MTEPYVTDHAVLRYIERVMGVDVESVRRNLSSAAVETAIEFGCETVILGNGARFKLKGSVVTTVLPARGH